MPISRGICTDKATQKTHSKEREAKAPSNEKEVIYHQRFIQCHRRSKKIEHGLP